MKNKSAAVRLCLSLLLCCGAFSTLASAQTVANKQQVMGQARGAYYNLRKEGVDAFQCSVTPNWDALLADQRKTDPAAADAAVKTLSQLQFTVSVASDNTVKLTHNDLTGQSKEMMDALKQIYGGMEQMASGFFDTWKLFVLSSPFPEVSSDYRLEAAGPQYRVSYREDTSDVVTTMGRDFAISNLQVTAAQFDSSIQPSFTKTPKGLLLNAYEASYQSPKPEEATKLKVAMDYQPVDGVQMLSKLNLTGSYGANPFAVELAFSDCKVTKKPQLPISPPRRSN